MQRRPQHLSAHDHGTHNGHTDVVSAVEISLDDACDSFLATLDDASLSYICASGSSCYRCC